MPETIREILQEIIDSRFSLKTQEDLISGIEDQESVLKEIVPLKDEIVYQELMKKPLLTGEDILNFPAQPNDYLIEKFIWKGNIVFLVGAEKACKSIFNSQLAMALTTGGNFLGTFDVARPLKVLYVQAEGDMSETKDRFIRATAHNGLQWNPENWRHFYPSSLCLDLDLDKDNMPIPGGYTDFITRIDQSMFIPDLIAIDPLYMAMEGDLIDNKASRQFCRNMRRLKERYQCSIIIAHHEHRAITDKFHNKIEEGDNAIFGSSMWKNFASHVFRISMTNERGNPIAPERENDNGVKYRKITCTTQRNNSVIKKIVLKLNQDPLMFEILDHKVSSGSEEAVLRYIETHSPIASCEVAEATGMNPQTVSSCFNRLYKKKGLIKIHSHKGNKTLYTSALLGDKKDG